MGLTQYAARVYVTGIEWDEEHGGGFFRKGGVYGIFGRESGSISQEAEVDTVQLNQRDLSGKYFYA